MKGDMYSARATDEEVVDGAENGGAVTALLKFAMESRASFPPRIGLAKELVEAGRQPFLVEDVLHGPPPGAVLRRVAPPSNGRFAYAGEARARYHAAVGLSTDDVPPRWRVGATGATMNGPIVPSGGTGTGRRAVSPFGRV